MLCLEGFSENIHNRALKGVKASDCLDSCECRGEMLISQKVDCCEELHVEVNESFECEFFRSEEVKVDIKTVALIELCNFGNEFLRQWKGGRCIAEPSDHMPHILLHFLHLFLEHLVVLLQLVSFFFVVGQFIHKDLHFLFELSQFWRVSVSGLVDLCFIMVFF